MLELCILKILKCLTHEILWCLLKIFFDPIRFYFTLDIYFKPSSRRGGIKLWSPQQMLIFIEIICKLGRLAIRFRKFAMCLIKIWVTIIFAAFSRISINRDFVFMRAMKNSMLKWSILIVIEFCLYFGKLWGFLFELAW